MRTQPVLHPTSPEYLTIPLINYGIPSVIYETYSKESFQKTRIVQMNL